VYKTLILEVQMSDSDDTMRLGEADGSLAGDALLHAMRQDMQGLFGLLNEKVEALDAKVEARLRDTTPMWEVVVSRLDNIVAEQESHGRRLDAIETEQRKQGARLDAIEGRLDSIEGRLGAIEIKLERFDAIDTELRHLRRRIERTIGQLSKDVLEYRVDQHDLEDRLEKLEKTPA
jgi:chromosome segregation ATPase